MGRDNFSIGAGTEDDDDAAFDGLLEIIELIEENDDCGRSVYNTSWLFADGKETAVAVMFAAAAVDDEAASINNNFSLSLSGGTFIFVDDVGSMAHVPRLHRCVLSGTLRFWHQFLKKIFKSFWFSGRRDRKFSNKIYQLQWVQRDRAIMIEW